MAADRNHVASSLIHCRLPVNYLFFLTCPLIVIFISIFDGTLIWVEPFGTSNSPLRTIFALELSIQPVFLSNLIVAWPFPETLAVLGVSEFPFMPEAEKSDL